MALALIIVGKSTPGWLFVHYLDDSFSASQYSMQQDAFDSPHVFPDCSGVLTGNWRLLQTRKVLGFLPITKKSTSAIAGSASLSTCNCFDCKLGFLHSLLFEVGGQERATDFGNSISQMLSNIVSASR